MPQAIDVHRAAKPDVVVIGELFIDEILSEFHELPKLGEEAFAKRYLREVGGGAAITACALARLGVHVTVLGSVGKSDGDWLVNRLTSLGVMSSALVKDAAEPTGLTVSVSTREDRAFFSYAGANHRLPGILRRSSTLDLMLGARHVHFACAPDAELDAPLLAALRRQRCRLSIDVQSHFSWLTRAENLALLKQCDIFFPNEQEGEWISGETGPRILRSLKEKGLRGVGLKLGGKGAALLWRNRTFLTDAYPSATVDTTGAGDCFNAGFIFGWLRGESPEQCLQLANICGSLSTRCLGGVGGFPSAQELEELRVSGALS
jgi:ribokinase